MTTHLQLFSHFSLMRSTVGLTALIERTRSEGVSALALTDFNALYGVV